MPKINKNSGTMQFAKDEFGKEILLQDKVLQVRMEWEKPYIEACIDLLKPHGNVLEIGFGLGYAASQIQKHHPKSHTIIESNPEVAARAKKWADKQKKAHITIVQDNWQKALKKMDAFDIIFFDDYSIAAPSDLQQIEKNAKQYQQAADKAGQVRNQIADKLKQFRGLKFSDDDLNEFASEAVHRLAITIQDVLEFIDSLAAMKNITAQQKKQFLQAFYEKATQHQILRSIITTENLKPVISRACSSEHLSNFIDACLKKHMRSGTRLSAYLGSDSSTLIHNKITSRKDVRLKEKSLPVKVPANCQYFEGSKALLITIEKK